jgi:thiol-disulfide isomerase/thioredoxin
MFTVAVMTDSISRRYFLIGGSVAGGMALLLPALAYSDEENKATKKGSRAQNFTLRDGNSVSSSYNQDVSLDNYGGKLTVLNFWDIWCGYCLSELPSLARLQKKYDSNIRVLGFSLNSIETIADIKDSYDEFDKANNTARIVTYPLLGYPRQEELNDQKKYAVLRQKARRVVQMYGVKSIPHTFFISADGVIKEDVSGARSFDDLETLVKKYI